MAYLFLKNGGGRWKMEVEDKWLKNTIFHHAIVLIINKLNLKRWKMEDRNAFFVGEHKNDDANFSARIKKAVFSPDNCKKRYIFGRDHFINLKRLKADS